MPPAPIFLSVATEDTLKPVVTAIKWAIMIITMAPNRPAFPTTQPRRMYMITPKIVSMDGVKTPANVPNFFLSAIGNGWLLVKVHIRPVI